jgi:hypothetical protein
MPAAPESIKVAVLNELQETAQWACVQCDQLPVCSFSCLKQVTVKGSKI